MPFDAASQVFRTGLTKKRTLFVSLGKSSKQIVHAKPSWNLAKMEFGEQFWRETMYTVEICTLIGRFEYVYDSFVQAFLFYAEFALDPRITFVSLCRGEKVIYQSTGIWWEIMQTTIKCSNKKCKKLHPLFHNGQKIAAQTCSCGNIIISPKEK